MGHFVYIQKPSPSNFGRLPPFACFVVGLLHDRFNMVAYSEEALRCHL